MVTIEWTGKAYEVKTVLLGLIYIVRGDLKVSRQDSLLFLSDSSNKGTSEIDICENHHIFCTSFCKGAFVGATTIISGYAGLFTSSFGMT